MTAPIPPQETIQPQFFDEKNLLPGWLALPHADASCKTKDWVTLGVGAKALTKMAVLMSI